MSYTIGMQDESLQSYVFRTILLNGENEFSSVIAKNGSWNVLVGIQQKHEVYFQRKSENRLLDLIKKNYEQYIRLNFHHNPFYYLEFYKFFFGNISPAFHKEPFSKLNRHKKTINFCKNCLLNGIEINGFGYFRASWDTQKFCEIHNTSLSYLPQSNRKKRVDEIRLILQGEEPASAIKYPIDHISRAQETFLENIAANHFNLPVTPCLLEIISHKLRRTVSDYYYAPEAEYDEKNDIIMQSMLKSLLYPSGVYKRVNAHAINRSLNILVKKKYSPIETFLTNLYEEVVAVNTIEKVDSCTERMLAPKLRECNKCKYPKTSCALSSKIVSFVQSRQMRIAQGDNYCDRVIRNSATWYPQKIHFTTSNINYSESDFFESRQYEYDLIDLISKI